MNPAIPVGSNGGTVSNINPAELVKILTAPAAYDFTVRALLQTPTLSIERRGHIVKVVRVEADRHGSSDLVCDVSGETFRLNLGGNRFHSYLEMLFSGYSKPMSQDSFEHVSGVLVRVAGENFPTGFESQPVSGYGFASPVFAREIEWNSRQAALTVNGRLVDPAKFPKVLTLDVSFSGTATVRELGGCSLSHKAVPALRAAGIELALGSLSAEAEVTWEVVDRFPGSYALGGNKSDGSTIAYSGSVKDVRAQVWLSDSRPLCLTAEIKADDVDSAIASVQERIDKELQSWAAARAAYGF